MLSSALLLLLFIHYCLGDWNQTARGTQISATPPSDPASLTNIISNAVIVTQSKTVSSSEAISPVTRELSSSSKFVTLTTVHKVHSRVVVDTIRTVKLNQLTVHPTSLPAPLGTPSVTHNSIMKTLTVTADLSTTVTQMLDLLPSSAKSSTEPSNLETSSVSPWPMSAGVSKLNSTAYVNSLPTITTSFPNFNISTADRNEPPTTAVPPKPTAKTLFPLFYIIIIVSISSTVFLSAVILGIYFSYCAHKRRKRKREQREQERRNRQWIPLHGLARTTSSGSSRSSTDGTHQVSVLNSTEVILRRNPRRTLSDSVDRRNSRLSLLFKKPNMKPTHTPTLSCSTFKPNQQLYLPHIQVQVHVNGDFNDLKAESRVGSFCKLDEAEESQSVPDSHSPSGDSENSIVNKLLQTR